MKCSICQNEINKNYCTECGQSFKGEKITFITIVQDFFGSIFSLETSFFENLKIALLQPKQLIDNYWKGFRGYYYSPGKFLTIASLFFIIQLTLNNDFFGIVVASKTSQQFTILFINILFFSLMSFVIYFQFKRNYIEHLILNIYTVSFWSIIFVPISMVLHLLKTPSSIKYGFIFLFFLLVMVWDSKVFELTTQKRFLYISLNILLLAGVIFLIGIYGLNG